MSYAIFIKMDSITGESRDAKHKGEIDVLSWNWGVTNHPSEIAGKVGAVSGKSSSSDLVFSHRIDLASPSLIKACASGHHLKEAIVTVQKAGPEPQEFLVIKLYEVIVTSVETGVDTLQNSVTENVAISFSRIEFVYTEQKPDGTLGGSNRVLWDIISNKVT
ncbi:MAG: type VI secretion system tube protein Hcp [Desulfobacterales bacterium]